MRYTITNNNNLQSLNIADCRQQVCIPVGWRGEYWQQCYFIHAYI